VPTLEQATDLFERRRQAWLADDLDAYLALWADDMTFQSPVHAEPLQGREAFAALVRASSARLRPLRFDFHHLAVVGDAVLAEWTIAAEYRESGAHLEWRGMSIALIRDGLIVHWREYWNPADLKPRRGPV
jgi:uncharacterized protein